MKGIDNKMRKGQIKNDRTGEISVNNYGSKMTIVEYNEYNNLIVEFENGYKTKCIYQQFKNKNITNPYDKTVFNIGYLGEGKYKSRDENGWFTQVYLIWNNILERCYDEKHRNKHPSYEGCTVCDEWLNFQNFGKWFDKNWYEVEEQRMELDKDILVKGNKVYSPENCIFVPKRINSL